MLIRDIKKLIELIFSNVINVFLHRTMLVVSNGKSVHGKLMLEVSLYKYMGHEIKNRWGQPDTQIFSNQIFQSA